jgi:hypothetical protein
VTAVDLANGLDVGREAVFSAPPDIPFWSENLLFAMYDAANDVGLWLHLGTIPNRWHLWEDRILVTLPGDAGVLASRSFRKTPPSERPAAANLQFTCREPYRRWHVTAETMAVRTSYAQMCSGLVRDGPKDHVSLDLDVICRTPVWDMHAMTRHSGGRGSMRDQSWASEHYEQLYTVTGSVSLPTGDVEFDGAGWRDHSRGPRGGETGAPWGGHVIMGAYFPDGDRGVGLCRYYHPDGDVTLEGAYVSHAGVLHPAVALDAPKLTSLQEGGESLRFGLQSPGVGETWLEAATTSSLWTMLKRSVHYFGIDPTGELGSVYVVNFATVEWDGEPAILYVERSAAPGVQITSHS